MVRIIETFSSRQQDSNSHLVIHLPPWCRQPYLICCMEWAPQEQRMQKQISCTSLKIKWWLKFSGIIIILSKWWSLFQQFKCSSTHHHPTAKLLRNKFACQKCFRGFRGAAGSGHAGCSTAEFCRSRVTDLFLFGKKQGSIFGIIVLQPGLGGLVPRILIEDIWIDRQHKNLNVCMHWTCFLLSALFAWLSLVGIEYLNSG